MSRVAIFTDSASDLDPAEAEASGIHVIPLLVSFGNATFKAGVDLSGPAFWDRMVAPDAPFPTTAASSPGDFKAAYEAAFAAGAEAIVSIHVAGTLSGTIKSAQIARDMLPDREIHIVDSQGASMAQGILAQMGVEMAAADRPAAEIAETLEERAPDMLMYVALETLEYLKKGGRISGAQAAIGTLLSVKPIIKVKHGVVTTADRVRTRSKVRERLIELITEAPIERLAILHTTNGGRRGVPRRDAPTPAASEARRRVGGARWCVRRAAPGAGLCRCRDPVQAGWRPGVKVAVRLRQPCRPVPSGRRFRPTSGYTRRRMSRASKSGEPAQEPSTRPVGSSGRRPTLDEATRDGRPTRRFSLP